MITKLIVTKEFGRGLYANTHAMSNETVMLCELLVLSENDTIKVNETELKYYTFKYNNTQDCLVLGDGEIFNHSDNPNVGYELVDLDGRKIMKFYTLRPIKANEQLFIDYNADTNVDVSKYVNNKSLMD